MGAGGRWRKLRRVTGCWGGESCGVVAGRRRDGSWLGRKVLSGARGLLIVRILIARIPASTCGSGLGCGCLGASGTLGCSTLSGGVGGSSIGSCALGLC